VLVIIYSVIFAPVRSRTRTAKKVLNCERAMTPTHAPRMMHAVFHNGSATKAEWFNKGCAIYHACNQLEKGNITAVCLVAYTPFVECKAKCCYGEECNKGDILDTTGYESSIKAQVKLHLLPAAVFWLCFLVCFWQLLVTTTNRNIILWRDYYARIVNTLVCSLAENILYVDIWML